MLIHKGENPYNTDVFEQVKNKMVRLNKSFAKRRKNNVTSIRNSLRIGRIPSGIMNRPERGSPRYSGSLGSTSLGTDGWTAQNNNFKVFSIAV